jgi:putative ABC transport system permease protein
VIAARLALQYPATNKDVGISLFPERLARPQPGAASGTPLIGGVLLALVGLVLLVTCVNVANLVLVRVSTRFREIALRASLGASRFRLFRQLLTESLLLAAFGGVAGAALGWWLTRLISTIRFGEALPLRLDLSFDWRVFGYTSLAVFTCGVLVGLAPAWQASRMNLSATLNEGGRSLAGGHRRMRSALVVAQVAGSLVVLIVAGLFVRSLQSAQKLDMGFNPRGVLILATDTGQLGYDEARGTAFYRAVKERVRAIPGVESAGFGFDVPMSSTGDNSERVWKEGQAGVPEVQVPVAGVNFVDEDYFRSMQIPLLRGRAIGEQDRKDSPSVAVINEAMAKLLWPGQDPIGRHFSFNKSDGRGVEVVGLTKTGKYNFIAENPRAFFYVPLSQNYLGFRVLAVRTAVLPMSLADSVERAFHTLDPDLPVSDVMSMEQSLAGANGFFLYRMGALFSSGLGTLGLLLAVVGVYGVISHSATQRSHEIGIRMAVGADRRDILRMIMSQGFGLVAIGIGIGLLIAAGFARLLRSLLLEISSMDPLTFFVVPALLLLVALVACYIPARRATRVDPLVALRYE